MVKIRLKRLGRKKKPFYRIVVTDIRNRRDGAPLAELGYYNPLSKHLKLDKTAALQWVANGAIPTDSAKRLIDQSNEAGELIQIEVKREEKLSKKALAAKKAAEEAAEAERKAAAEAAEAAKKAAEEAAAAPAEEAAAE